MPEVDVVTVPLLALDQAVILPGMVVTMALESDEAKTAFAAAEAGDGQVVVVARVGTGFSRVGVLARLETLAGLPDAGHVVALRAQARAVVGAGVAGPRPGTWVQVEPVTEATPSAGDAGLSARLGELAKEYRAVVESILEDRGAAPLARSLRSVTDPGALADTAGYLPELSFEQRVELLETVDVEARLRLVLGWAREVLAEASIKERIRSDVTEGMEASQREFLLRQQLAAIRKELGETDSDDMIGDYRLRAEEAELPEAVRPALERELDRLDRTSEQSPEHGWIRTWIDTVLDLPWGQTSVDRTDLAEARGVLDADHQGLSEVKDRIGEYLAVRHRRAERGRPAVGGRGSGAILTLVGPPGVGKTSLGASVARALGRSFVRVSLGGVRDEAEIRGHRRTYVGALPGRIVRAIAEAGTMNPVILLDEVDKLGADWRGDPASALLEVLDPAQNHTFRDHYLELDLDLSDVVFIATANVVDTVPPALLDRMETIRLDGYTEDEKLGIARHHLLGRQRELAGLSADELEITDAALRAVIADYTREAGVRELERRLARVCRKVATSLAAGRSEGPVTVDAADLAAHLGRPRVPASAVAPAGVPGVATGLAVTGAGGDVLVVEAASLTGPPGQADLLLTGQLGEVMRESATIAVSYVRSHGGELGLSAEQLAPSRIHVHVPSGAVPKDGPSAGITMVSAITSLLSGRPLHGGLAMTGEVSLQGRVLPIGGVKQKVLAAHRAGVGQVILPAANGPDLDDVPETVREAIVFHLVEDAAEVVRLALEEAPPGVPLAA